MTNIKKRNIFVWMLEEGVISKVMSYLSIRKVLPLQQVIRHRVLRPQRERLNSFFEREFVRYLGGTRNGNPDIGGKGSQLCRLITMFYLSTL